MNYNTDSSLSPAFVTLQLAVACDSRLTPEARLTYSVIAEMSRRRLAAPSGRYLALTLAIDPKTARGALLELERLGMLRSEGGERERSTYSRPSLDRIYTGRAARWLSTRCRLPLRQAVESGKRSCGLLRVPEVKPTKKRAHVQIPLALLFDSEVSSGAKIVYAVLREMRRKFKRDPRTSTAYLAGLTGRSERTIVRDVAELVQRGLVTSEGVLGRASTFSLPDVEQVYPDSAWAYAGMKRWPTRDQLMARANGLPSDHSDAA